MFFLEFKEPNSKYSSMVKLRVSDDHEGCALLLVAEGDADQIAMVYLNTAQLMELGDHMYMVANELALTLESEHENRTTAGIRPDEV